LLNVATGTSATFRAIAEMVAARAGRSVEIAPSARQNPVTHRHFDITNLLRAFPGTRLKSLDEGLAAMFVDMRAEASG
jgi:nucleoside-diphosphate-sugar epimerase